MDPCTATFYTALSKQENYENAEIKAKSKHEASIVKNLKHNCKPLFHYLNTQKKAKVHVSKLKKKDGQFSSTPNETVEILAEHFQSVFKQEQFGPLPKECYSIDDNRTSPNSSTDSKPYASDAKVKKHLSDLDINKAMGPDRVPPKVPKVLSMNPDFVAAVTKLYNRCIEFEYIPSQWKLAHVVPVHKKGSYLCGTRLL